MPKRMKGVRHWHATLLPLPEVKSWYENLARRDVDTADDYLRRVGRVLHEALGKTPADLVALPQKQLEDAVTACYTHLFQKGLLGSTVNAFRIAVTSYLAWHRREIERSNAIPGAEEYPNAENETLPDQAVLRGVVAVCEVRTKAMLLVIAHGGQRPQVLGKNDASDGLRLRDLIDLDLNAGTPGFAKVPCQVEVSRNLSKNRKRYFFFLGPEACQAIQAYLQARIERGEELTSDSPLFRPDGGAPRFVARNNLCTSIRLAMQRAGFAGRPYVWRAYYAHHCQFAESKNFLESWRKFFMGHKGDIQTRYANRKANIPSESVDKMRRAYAEALPSLETHPEVLEDTREQLAAIIVRASGIPDAKLEELNLEGRTEEEAAQAFRQALEAQFLTPTPPASPAPATDSARPRQRLVQPHDLSQALHEGWRVKLQLSDGALVMEA